MNAMLNQLDPVTVLTNFNQIAGGRQGDRGDRHPDLARSTRMMDLALKAKKLPVVQRGRRAAADPARRPRTSH